MAIGKDKKSHFVTFFRYESLARREDLFVSLGVLEAFDVSDSNAPTIATVRMAHHGIDA
ncbi:MAG: hypothetical protein LBI16_00360 [Burkholderiales bacterium]|jgi:hypothetical protein|nr:hypothetical protein [Burkholderiales bacterium]